MRASAGIPPEFLIKIFNLIFCSDSAKNELGSIFMEILWSGTKFKGALSHIVLLSSRDSEYDCQGSYKYGSDCNYKIRIAVSSFNRFPEPLRLAILKLWRPAAGVVMWLATCIFIVFSLAFIGHKKIIFASAFYLLAVLAIWYGFWYLVLPL